MIEIKIQNTFLFKTNLNLVLLLLCSFSYFIYNSFITLNYFYLY